MTSEHKPMSRAVQCVVASHAPAAPTPPSSTRRHCLDAAPPPPEPGHRAWNNVLRNLRSGSEDGIRNALLLIDARGLRSGPALARLQAPRPSVLVSSSTERHKVELLLRAAILEAERLSARRAASPA